MIPRVTKLSSISIQNKSPAQIWDAVHIRCSSRNSSTLVTLGSPITSSCLTSGIGVPVFSCVSRACGVSAWVPWLLTPCSPPWGCLLYAVWSCVVPDPLRTILGESEVDNVVSCRNERRGLVVRLIAPVGLGRADPDMGCYASRGGSQGPRRGRG